MWLCYRVWFNFFATRLDKGWCYFPGIELFIRYDKENQNSGFVLFVASLWSEQPEESLSKGKSF